MIGAIRKVGAALIAAAIAHSALAAQVPPHPDPPFKGRIAFSIKDSVPYWPEATRAPPGAPNIVIVLLDDIGFADTSTFGGVAQTPELDRFAALGLRYINFNNTSQCSPTRAALLSGRNHHRVGFGVAEGAGGYPGYNTVWNKNTASIPEILRRHGYSTAAFGKWHNTPYWEISPIGPFDRWPTGLGFEYFYGFLAGLENQWEPARLYRNTTAVEPPASPQQGYHLTTDLADEAINWVRTHEALAPQKPYFLYFATGAVHTPHHAPKEWIDRYRGQFDQGWDRIREQVFARQKQLGVIPANAQLTPRPDVIPAWNGLSADQKRLYARQMEVYAGFISHTDYEVGRLLKAIRQGQGGDNTLILYIVGDNGANNGGPDGATDSATSVVEQIKHIDELGSYRVPLNLYSAGWGWLGSTPFQWWKTIASHFGGVRNPLLISWPARIKDRGGLRTQFTHVNDVAATLYDVTGIPFPQSVDGVKQHSLDGVSFAQTFDRPDAPSRHHTQYFEMRGNRAIYQDGWVAGARHWKSWDGGGSDFTHDRWELYNVAEDFSEAHDVAGQYPGKLAALQKLFDAEARRNAVYPLGGGGFGGGREPSLAEDRGELVFYAGMPRIPGTAMPRLSGRSFRITAEVSIPDTGAQGVIVSYGGRESGFALYIKGGRLYFENNPLNGAHELIGSNIPVPHGQVTLGYEYLKLRAESSDDYWGWPSIETSSGIGRLRIDGRTVGERKVSGAVVYAHLAPGSLGVGQEFGSPVSNAFVPPFKFSGVLKQVKVEQSPEPVQTGSGTP